MLRRHNVTLAFDERQDIYSLNVDGYIINITMENLVDLMPYLETGGKEGAEKVADFLKIQDANLYDSKLTPIADNQNAWDVMEVLQCQIEKDVHVQKPE